MEDYPSYKKATQLLGVISYLRGDTIYDLVDKLDILHDNNRLERIDYMLEKDNIDDHYELNDILQSHQLGNSPVTLVC